MARRSFTDQEVEKRRGEILEASLTLFETGGFSNVSFRKIASTLGCSYATPYHYFPGKEALLTAMRAHAFRWIASELESALDRSEPPRQRLRTLSEVLVRLALERPQRYALLFFRLSEIDSGPRSEELAVAKRDALYVCTRAVAEAQAAGEITLAVDPLTISHVLWAGMHGLISLEVADQFSLGRSIEDLLPHMTRTLLRGFESSDDRSA